MVKEIADDLEDDGVLNRSNEEEEEPNGRLRPRWYPTDLDLVVYGYRD